MEKEFVLELSFKLLSTTHRYTSVHSLHPTKMLYEVDEPIGKNWPKSLFPLKKYFDSFHSLTISSDGRSLIFTKAHQMSNFKNNIKEFVNSP